MECYSSLLLHSVRYRTSYGLDEPHPSDGKGRKGCKESLCGASTNAKQLGEILAVVVGASGASDGAQSDTTDPATTMYLSQSASCGGATAAERLPQAVSLYGAVAGSSNVVIQVDFVVRCYGMK
jgi:hypothetical protein